MTALDRLSTDHAILTAAARIPTPFGDFTGRCLQDAHGDAGQLALIRGDIGDGHDVLVRVHSECLTGDVFGSQRCDCGPQLNSAMRVIADEGRGVVVYVLGHEGRGIGLFRKLQAYELQDMGADTVDANLELGLPVDDRDYRRAAQLLLALGVRTVRLLTNNPHKLAGLEAGGLTVLNRVPMPVAATDENLGYLLTKRDRLGHDLPGLPGLPPSG